MPYFVYIIECADGSYYVGHTDNPAMRERAHNAGRGARYTAGRLPVKLVYTEPLASRHEAMTREQQIKGWTRGKKAALIAGDRNRPKSLAKRRTR